MNTGVLNAKRYPELAETFIKDFAKEFLEICGDEINHSDELLGVCELSNIIKKMGVEV